MKLGIHVAKKSKVIGCDDPKGRKTRKTIVSSMDDDISSLKLNIAQVYTHGPRNNKRNNINCKNIGEYCEENDIDIIVHSTHILPNMLWKVNMGWYSQYKKGEKDAINDEDYDDIAMYERCMGYLEDQFLVCKQIGDRCKGLVVHLGDVSIGKMVKILPILGDLIDKYKIYVFFENVHVRINPNNDTSYDTYDSEGEWKMSEKDKKKINIDRHVDPGSNQCSSARRLDELCSGFSKILNPKVWGICIDTAHVWSCGVSLTWKFEQDKYFKLMKKKTKKQIKLFHLNGSKCKTFRKNRDEHYIAMSKQDDLYPSDIPPEDLGIFSIIEFSITRGVPIICEINRGTEKEVRRSIKKIKKMAKNFTSKSK